VAWVDPQDQLDPFSARAVELDLKRLLWLRGGGACLLKRMLSATATLLGSGLFEIVVLDLAAVSAEELRRLRPRRGSACNVSSRRHPRPSCS